MQINNYDEYGLKVVGILEDINRPKAWMAKQIGITYQAFCYKLKGYHSGFSRAEMMLIERIAEDEKYNERHEHN